MMNLVTVMAEYVTVANGTYADLEQMAESFARDAQIIEHAKCLLLRNGELSDFTAGGTAVGVFRTFDGYELHYDGMVMALSVEERQIIGFVLCGS